MTLAFLDVKSKLIRDYNIDFDAFGSTTTIGYNFCRHVDKKCSTEAPHYYAVAYNTTDCYYMNENAANRTNYALIKTEKETGLQINYYDVRETGQVFQLNLICDNEFEQLAVVNNTLADRTFITYAKSKDICPQVLSTIIYDFFNTFKWVFFVLGLIIGPIELLLGNKIFKITVFLVG